MKVPVTILPRSLFVVVASLLALATSAAEWRDRSGTQIKGKPIKVVGPFALCREGAGKGHRVLLQGLSEADWVRLYEETADSAEKGDSFATATGSITKQLVGRVQRVRDGVLVDADLRHQAEPELLVVLYGHPHNENLWSGLGNMVSTYERLKRVWGDRIEFVYFGAGHEPRLQAQISEQMFMPWLVANQEAGRRVTTLSRMAKSPETRMMMISRAGAPILAGNAEDLAANLRFIDQLGDLGPA